MQIVHVHLLSHVHEHVLYLLIMYAFIVYVFTYLHFIFIEFLNYH